jgi:hypothetical protein
MTGSLAGGPAGRDDRPDRVVPAYALTRGRTRPSGGRPLPLESVLTATDTADRHSGALSLEGRQICGACRAPQSVAEIGVLLQVPVGVARVLVSELAEAGFLQLHLPLKPVGDAGGPGMADRDRHILGRLLDGLRAR